MASITLAACTSSAATNSDQPVQTQRRFRRQIGVIAGGRAGYGEPARLSGDIVYALHFGFRRLQSAFMRAKSGVSKSAGTGVAPRSQA